MDINLNSEQRQLVEKNKNLVAYVVEKHYYTAHEKEDIISAGYIGLAKAVYYFSDSKGNKFTSFAFPCIKNEINMYFRKNKKFYNFISLDSKISESDLDKQLKLEDVVYDETYSIEDIVENKDIISDFLEINLNCLKPIEKVILMYILAKKEQSKIADIIGVSQSYISRLQKKILYKSMNLYKNKPKYKNKYHVKYIGEFITLDINLENIELSVPDFKNAIIELEKNKNVVNHFCDNKRNKFKINFIPEIEFFSIIGLIIYKIEFKL